MLALVDCNNFFASCEQIFRPELRGRPVIVLSNNDGCVVARSSEAKALGIRMCEPAFRIRETIARHKITVFSSNYALYADISGRVMAILEKLAPRVEIYSVDEAFISLDGIGDLEDFAGMLRETLLKWTGITVAIGVAETKTLAKLANHAAKKYPGTGGIVNLTAKRRERLLAITPIEEIWGIGRKTAEKLHRLGIDTALDLRDADPSEIGRNFSVVTARTVTELRGTQSLQLHEIPASRKQLVTSRTFGRRITRKEEMCQAISEFTEKSCQRLRKERQFARSVVVFMSTNPHANTPQYSNTIQGTLPHQTNDTIDINSLAQQLLSRIWKNGYEYNKAGVMLLDLATSQRYQRCLFEKQAKDTTELMKAIDRINAGIGKIHLASTGLHHAWAVQRNNLSPAYTTSWEDLPVI